MSEKEIKNHKELEVWQKAYQLCVEVHKITESFPEDGYVTSEIREAAASVPSKIAAGYGRRTAGECIEDLYRAYSYLLDLETQILLSEKLGYINSGDLQRLKREIGGVGRMLKGLIRSLLEERIQGITGMGNINGKE